MTHLETTHEVEDLGGGRFRHTQHMRPIAYDDGGIMRLINSNFIDGDEQYPHIITAARLMTSVAPDGGRRIHPTREIDRYLQIGAPYIKPAATWTKVNLGAATRSANLLTWTTANANVYIQHAGHFVKLAILLKGGWQPPNGQFAFPVDLVGLTRSGGTVLADGVPVMSVRAPHVEDLDNPDDVRPMVNEFVQVDSQWYVLFTLPSLAGMSRPLIDPTLELQPDETAGIDTFLRSAQPSKNYGTFNQLRAGVSVANKKRTLISFDISSIPAGSNISSATLSLFCSSEIAATDYDFAVHRGLNQWYEGLSNDATPGAGEDASTWYYRNYNGLIAWTGGNGGGAGNDYATVATDTTTVTGTGAAFDWDVTADVAAFVAGSATNYGWWIIGNEAVSDSFKVFSPSNIATAGQRPKLTVEYTTGGLPRLDRMTGGMRQLGGSIDG